MNLTSTHEDYIEWIHRLQRKAEGKGVRITDLANALGCRLPTVTRTVKTLSEFGYVNHKFRGLVSLTTIGITLADEILHRHEDVYYFLTEILGLSSDEAEQDTCQLEHGFSPKAAKRLHYFLEYMDQLPQKGRDELRLFLTQAPDDNEYFSHLPVTKTHGWRG